MTNLLQTNSDFVLIEECKASKKQAIPNTSTPATPCAAPATKALKLLSTNECMRIFRFFGCMELPKVHALGVTGADLCYVTTAKDLTDIGIDLPHLRMQNLLNVIRIEYKHDGVPMHIIEYAEEESHTHVLEDGSIYKGRLVDGQMHGYGVLNYHAENAKERVRYEGEFKENQPNGKGKMIWRSGETYVGDWVNDTKEGFGIMHYNPIDDPTRLSYEGEWKDGSFHGQGQMKFRDGRLLKGRWKDNEVEGVAMLTYPKENKHKRMSYEGEFLNYKMHGKGRFIWSDGCVYQGEFKNDARHGFGIETYGTSGFSVSEYKGEYRNGERSGKGQLVYANGDTYKGPFINDLPHGIGKTSFANGFVDEGYHWRGYALYPLYFLAIFFVILLAHAFGRSMKTA